MDKKKLQQFKKVYEQCFPNKSWTSVESTIGVDGYKFDFIDSQNEITAFIITRQISSTEVEILDIGTSPQNRTSGLAKQLIKSLYNYAKIYLEVDEGNITAINLYKKLGFEVTGIRKNYYKNKGHQSNALNMEKNI